MARKWLAMMPACKNPEKSLPALPERGLGAQLLTFLPIPCSRHTVPLRGSCYLWCDRRKGFTANRRPCPKRIISQSKRSVNTIRAAFFRLVWHCP